MRSILRVSFFVFLFSFLLAAGSPAACQEGKAFVGDWSGKVIIPEAEIEIICHFQADESGNLTGTIDSPSQGAFGLKLAQIKVEGKKISFGIDDPNVPGEPKFNGVLDDAGTKISGDFSQGGAAGSFELNKK